MPEFPTPGSQELKESIKDALLDCINRGPADADVNWLCEQLSRKIKSGVSQPFLCEIITELFKEGRLELSVDLCGKFIFRAVR
ncbi:MAG: hypothetical protein WC459_00865 [Patescibacteria group bacterium]